MSKDFRQSWYFALAMGFMAVAVMVGSAALVPVGMPLWARLSHTVLAVFNTLASAFFLYKIKDTIEKGKK